jgi:hypothetical protein
MLAAGEGREATAAAQARRGAGEQHGAAAARHHGLRGLARRQEASEGRHLPDLAVDAGRRVADVEAHVAADVEDEDLDVADLGLDLAEQFYHLLLVARVGAEGVDLAALAGDLSHQVLQLVGAAPCHHGGVAFARKATGDSTARRIARTDHDTDLVSRHGRSPLPPICRRLGDRSREITS